MANQVRKLTMLIFIPVNGFLSLPHIATIKNDIKILMELGDKIQKTANKFIKRLEDDINNRNIRIAV